MLMGIPVYVTYGYLANITLRNEYFAYTHWPVRFNRKTRMVHVFRHNGKGGTLSVPWDEVYFHIGRGGKQRPNEIYIRGHILDGDIVKDTFALGHDVPKEKRRALLEMWEFIRSYMNEGPNTAGPHPMDRYVSLSVTPSLYNCYMMMDVYYTGDFNVIKRFLAFPVVAICTGMRWPVPRRMADFAESVPGLLEHAMKKERARNEGQDSFGK